MQLNGGNFTSKEKHLLKNLLKDVVIKFKKNIQN